MTQRVVRVSQIIAKHFYGVWLAIKRFLYIEIWLAGGRGSTKSSVISLAIVRGIVNDPLANAVIYRKTKVDIRDSVLEQMWWAVCKLELEEYFDRSDNPARITYIPTGQKIIFRGLDKAKKSKAIKVARGCLRYLWFEELDEYAGYQEVHSVIESVMRGHPDGKAIIFCSYNPPESANSWVNVEAAKDVDYRLVHKSTYIDVPKDWLGEVFLRVAEGMRHSDPEQYDHVYLGKITGTGGMIFKKIVKRTITQEEIDSFRTVRWGLDFGFENDPSVLIGVNYDVPSKTITIFDEWVAQGAFEEDILDELKKRDLCGTIINADSAEPRSIKRLQLSGARYMKKCYKAAHFPAVGIRWMRSRYHIVIDPKRTPVAYREFSQYQHEKLADGSGYRNDYPDRDNHAIDACRYALENEIRFDQSHRMT